MTDQDLDPTIAALLAETQADSGPSDLPSFKDISESPSEKKTEESAPAGAHKVDLSQTGFSEITKFYEEESNHIFDDKAYYKTALGGEGDQAQRVHKILSKYLTCQDPKDRTVYRQQLVTSWWELIRVMCPKAADRNLEKPKQMLMRFGVVLPSLFTPEQKQLFSTVILENNTGEPVYYMDEWFKEIATGRLNLSATDEARTPRKNDPGAEAQRIQQLKSKNDGKLQNAESLLNSKESERQMIENELRNRVDSLCEHSPMIGLEPHKQPYTEGQKKLFGEIQEKLRALQKIDKELAGYMKEYEEAKAIGNSLEDKMSAQPEAIEVSTIEEFLNRPEKISERDFFLSKGCSDFQKADSASLFDSALENLKAGLEKLYSTAKKGRQLAEDGIKSAFPQKYLSSLTEIDSQILHSEYKEIASLVFPTEKRLASLVAQLPPLSSELKSSLQKSSLIYGELMSSVSQYKKFLP